MKNKTPLNDNEIEQLLSRLKKHFSEYPEDLREKRRKVLLGSIPIITIPPNTGVRATKIPVRRPIAFATAAKVGIAIIIGLSAIGSILFWDELFPEVKPTSTLIVITTNCPTLTSTATSTSTFLPFFDPTDTGKHLGQTPTPPAKRTPTP